MITKNNWELISPVNQETDQLPFIDRLLSYKGLNLDKIHQENVQFFDARMMNDMTLALPRILSAIENHEKIMIYGDYDVDGMMATSIMMKGLQFLGAECEYFIPDRFCHGYGFSKTTSEIVAAEWPDLIISVDCGITAGDFMEFFSNLGIDVIITDHHECPEILPDALAVIDCKRNDNTYPFCELCGAGVAYKLIDLLVQETGMDNETWDELNAELMQYAATATIADVVPLWSENRSIVKTGIDLIRTSPVRFIKHLVSVLEKPMELKNISSQDIAFYIAPMMNAASRMGNLNAAMKLFLTDNDECAYSCARELAQLNQKRKQIEQQMTIQADNLILTYYSFSSSDAMIICGNQWHRGVTGIVAAKLAEKYSRPCIIFSKDEKGILHGTCRSWKNINIMEALRYAEDFILQFGGHAGAAGLTIKEEDFQNFVNRINEYMMTINPACFQKTLPVDMMIRAEEITLENADKMIDTLAPFGTDNKEPLFVCKNLKIKSISRIGKSPGAVGGHIKIVFCPKNNPLQTIEAVGFSMGDYAEILTIGRTVNVLFSMSINEWQNNRNVQMMIREIRFAEVKNETTGTEICGLYDDHIITIPDIAENAGVSIGEILPTDEEYIKTANTLRTMFKETHNQVMITTLDILTAVLSAKTDKILTPFKVSRILAACGESGVMEYKKCLFNQIIVARPTGLRPIGRISQTQQYARDHGIQ